MSEPRKPPSREAAQEFYTNVIDLGKLARENYMRETRLGLRSPNFTELRELDMNIEICEKELEKFK